LLASTGTILELYGHIHFICGKAWRGIQLLTDMTKTPGTEKKTGTARRCLFPGRPFVIGANLVGFNVFLVCWSLRIWKPAVWSRGIRRNIDDNPIFYQVHGNAPALSSF